MSSLRSRTARCSTGSPTPKISGTENQELWETSLRGWATERNLPIPRRLDTTGTIRGTLVTSNPESMKLSDSPQTSTRAVLLEALSVLRRAMAEEGRINLPTKVEFLNEKRSTRAWEKHQKISLLLRKKMMLTVAKSSSRRDKALSHARIIPNLLKAFPRDL